MPHEHTAQRWGLQPGFVKALRHWTWCRDALPPLMRHLARDAQVDEAPTVDMDALARAYWDWAATLDGNAGLEPLEPVDYAHFEVGMLVSLLVGQRVVRFAAGHRSAEIRVLTETGLTVLAAWSRALGAEPQRLDVPEPTLPRWMSYVENVVEDPAVAVAFIDLFTGREPVWQFPTMPTERPAFKSALERRRPAG